MGSSLSNLSCYSVVSLPLYCVRSPYSLMGTATVQASALYLRRAASSRTQGHPQPPPRLSLLIRYTFIIVLYKPSFVLSCFEREGSLL